MVKWAGNAWKAGSGRGGGAAELAATMGGGWRRGQSQVAGRRWPGTENETPAAGRLGEDARGRFSPKMARGGGLNRKGGLGFNL